MYTLPGFNVNTFALSAVRVLNILTGVAFSIAALHING